MTYLQIVNKVMRRLRQNEVASVSQDNYSKLIGEFVNETKREVEDAWNWTRLRTNISVTTSSGTSEYTLTNAGERFTLLKDELGNPIVFNATDDAPLFQIAHRDMVNLQTVGSVQNATPSYFIFSGSTSGDPDIEFWPIPDNTYTINFQMVVAQDDLSSDTDVLTVPSWPVILGAYAKAIDERGEDSGVLFTKAEDRYNKALSDAIVFDAINLPTETNWATR